MDSFVGEDGAVITVLKMELPWMDEGYEAQIMALEGMEEAQKERLVTQARTAREALLGQTGGELSLCVPYEVFHLCGGRRRGPLLRRGERLGQLPHPGGGNRTVKQKEGSRPKSALA